MDEFMDRILNELDDDQCSNKKYNKVNQISKPTDIFGLKNNNCIGKNQRSAVVEKEPKKSLIQETCFRKFPGPAGLLPTLAQNQVEELSGLAGIENNAILLRSKYSSFLLSKPSYQKFVQDFGLNTLNNPLNNLTIDNVFKVFFRRGIKNSKIPFLGLIVTSFTEDQDVIIKLMDPTNEISAVMGRKVWETLKEDFKVDSVVVLTQVAVIASVGTQAPITLFISQKNILSTYTEVKHNKTEKKTFQVIPDNELKATCQQWLTQMGLQSQVSSSPSITSNNKNSRNKDKWSLENEFSNLNDFGFSYLNDNTNISKKCKGNDIRNAISSQNGGKIKTSNSTDDSNMKNFSMSTPNPEKNQFFSQGLTNCSQSQTLSATEELMVQEVLSGINFEEFEL